MREKVGVKVVKALKRKDHGVTHAAVDMLCALMQVCKNYSEKKDHAVTHTDLTAYLK